MNAKQPKDDSLLEESDTDVGSNVEDDEESYNFDNEEDTVVGEDAAVDGTTFVDSGGGAGTPETHDGSSVCRMGAKVRKLDIGGDGGGYNDVKQSAASASKGSLFGAEATSTGRNTVLFGGGGAVYTKPKFVEPLIESPTQHHVQLPQTVNVRFQSSPPPPNSGSCDWKTAATIMACPPSTAKKGRVSRLFIGRGGENDIEDSFDSNDEYLLPPPQCRGIEKSAEEEEEDISPRDVDSFPFFGSPSNKRGKENKHHQEREDTTEDNNSSKNVFLYSDSMASQNQATIFTNPHSPECPTTTRKKPNRRMDLMTTSPPRGLRAHGRANSFLQMFSQEPLLTETDDANNESGEDDFLHRQPKDDNFMEEDYTLGSPKRPIRNQGKARSSPIDLSPATMGSSSSFSRFAADFEIVGTLGNGSFGCVYKVRNRMDRRLYAIKAAKREARGISDRDRMLQEVYALAALSDQTSPEAMHIVRYHQAWMEGNRLYIQTELCDGSLKMEMTQGVMEEKRRYKLLREMLLALDFVHKSGMIHLDIKVRWCEIEMLRFVFVM